MIVSGGRHSSTRTDPSSRFSEEHNVNKAHELILHQFLEWDALVLSFISYQISSDVWNTHTRVLMLTVLNERTVGCLTGPEGQRGCCVVFDGNVLWGITAVTLSSEKLLKTLCLSEERQLLLTLICAATAQTDSVHNYSVFERN